MKRLEISTGGTITLPPDVLQRWKTSAVILEDHGDYLVLRPDPQAPAIPKAVAGRP